VAEIAGRPPVKPAVFLDRDGTLIEERGYLDRLDDIALFAGAPAALTLLRDAGYALVLVTNQAGVARGFFDEAFVQAAHRRLADLLAAEGLTLDGYYYCPHHPEGVVAGYARVCQCRKPAPGMVEQAVRDLDIDVDRSFVVGDKWLDVELATNAGARGILVRTGYGAGAEESPGPYQPLAIVDTVLDAAHEILRHTAETTR
jgi:D-glycero-D-manno-heptose 1,7-bisphosphate phosphatase